LCTLPTCIEFHFSQINGAKTTLVALAGMRELFARLGVAGQIRYMQWHNLKQFYLGHVIMSNQAWRTNDDGVSKRESDDTVTFEQQDRARSIDLLRGMSVLVMVLVHYMIYCGNEDAMKSALYFVLSNVLGNVGAAGFLASSGMSHALAANGRFRKGLKPGRPWRECDEFRCAWALSLKLLGVELLMLALAWGPRRMINWDILTLQASSALVLHGCRRLPSPVFALLSACIALATPALRSLPGVDFAAAWGGGFRDAPFTETFAPGLVYDPVRGVLEVQRDVNSVAQGYLITRIVPCFPGYTVFVSGASLTDSVNQIQQQGGLDRQARDTWEGVRLVGWTCFRSHQPRRLRDPFGTTTTCPTETESASIASSNPDTCFPSLVSSADFSNVSPIRKSSARVLLRPTRRLVPEERRPAAWPRRRERAVLRTTEEESRRYSVPPAVVFPRTRPAPRCGSCKVLRASPSRQ
jgi:uncharacterized membrane protein